MLRSLNSYVAHSAFLCLILAPLVLAIPTNVTIDDQTGDAVTGLKPTYSPSTAWNQGAGCDFCAAKPNISDAGGGTWHDGTYVPGGFPEQFDFTLQFNGTAIWIYNIVQSRIFTALNFTLDGEDAGSFVWDNASSLGFVYNQAVFARQGLQQGPHTVVATASGSNQSAVLFDYAIYTTDLDTAASGAPSSASTSLPASTSVSASSSSPGSSHTTPVGPIVGGVIGGLALIALVILALLYHRRRRGRKISDKPEAVQPFHAVPSEQSPTIASKKGSSPTYLPASFPRYPDSDTESPHTPHMTSFPGPTPVASTSVHDTSPPVPLAPPGTLTADTWSTISVTTPERERQLADEVERLRSEMMAMRSGRPPPVLPNYEAATEDVLIYRQ